eukprot:124325-Pelagomonas_calceolata.AAC.1
MLPRGVNPVVPKLHKVAKSLSAEVVFARTRLTGLPARLQGRPSKRALARAHLQRRIQHAQSLDGGGCSC